MTQVDSRACIDPKAQLAADVQVGPFTVIGPDVVIGPGCKIHNAVTITGPTVIGANNEFYPNAVIGAVPQDLKYRGGPTQLIIGSDNIFRESCSIHRGTEVGGGKTIIGDRNLIMGCVHIAHDSVVEDNVIVANNAMIAGHVKLERCVVISGGVAIHHFVTVGRNAMIGGLARVTVDIPPFMIFEGNPGAVRGVNVKSLVRNGFSDDQIEAVKDAYKRLFMKGKGQFLTVLDELEKEAVDPSVRYLIESLRRSQKGKYGRYLENLRTDSPEDIGNFYKDKNKGNNS